MVFVDTNYFLRFLLKDNIQHKIAKNLFLQASRGKIELITSLIVIFEIYWVLTSYYGQKKLEVTDTLLNILKMNFRLEERDILMSALELFKTHNLSFEDCYSLAFVQEKQIKQFKTFDQKLLKAFSNL